MELAIPLIVASGLILVVLNLVKQNKEPESDIEPLPDDWYR